MELASNPIVALLILLGVLVFGHELGHYLVGRICGIAVEIFSIGFGPPIFRLQRGETEYRISLLPLGGFVKFYGAIPSEPVPDAVKGREFYRSAPAKRMATIAAGPIANLLIAAIAFTATGMAGVAHQRPIVGQILPDGAAKVADFRPRDIIKNIDGQEIKTWNEMLEKFTTSAGVEMSVTIERDGEELNKRITPVATEASAYPGAEKKPVGRVGIGMGIVPNWAVAQTSNSLFYRKTGWSVARIESVRLGANKRSDLQFFSEFTDYATSFLGKTTERELELKLSHFVNEDTKQVGFSLPRWVRDQKSLLNFLGIRDAQVVVNEVRDEDLKKTLHQYDRILKIGDVDVENIFSLSQFLTENREKNVDAEVVNLQNFERRRVKLALLPKEVQTPAGKEVVYTLPATFLGQPIAPEPYIEKYANPLTALIYGARKTFNTSGYLVETIGDLITGDVPLASLGGPILIAKVASESAKRGWITFLTTLAFISVNLAMINLLPVPVFDGGQLIVVGVEAIRRRPLSEVATENFQKVGFVIILVLMFLATYNDVMRVWISKL